MLHYRIDLRGLPPEKIDALSEYLSKAAFISSSLTGEPAILDVFWNSPEAIESVLQLSIDRITLI